MSRLNPSTIPVSLYYDEACKRPFTGGAFSDDVEWASGTDFFVMYARNDGEHLLKDVSFMCRGEFVMLPSRSWIEPGKVIAIMIIPRWKREYSKKGQGLQEVLRYEGGEFTVHAVEVYEAPAETRKQEAERNAWEASARGSGQKKV